VCSKEYTFPILFSYGVYCLPSEFTFFGIYDSCILADMNRAYMCMCIYRVVILHSDRLARCRAPGSYECLSANRAITNAVQEKKINFETKVPFQRRCCKCSSCARKHALQNENTHWFTRCSSAGEILDIFSRIFSSSSCNMWGFLLYNLYFKLPHK
jgi:hypothetical protein